MPKVLYTAKSTGPPPAPHHPDCPCYDCELDRDLERPRAEAHRKEEPCPDRAA